MRSLRWTSAAKTGVGTAIGSDSCLWFTLSHGIVTEVFDAFVDDACLRGMGFVVTNRQDFLSDELHDADSTVSYLAEGVPAFEMENRCRSGRYKIDKTVLSDPRRSVLLQDTCVHGAPRENRRLLVVSARRTAFRATKDKTTRPGWTNSKECRCCLRDKPAMPGRACLLDALAGPLGRLCRHVGWPIWISISTSACSGTTTRAEDGNVILTAEIDLAACQGRFVVAAGFGRNEHEAGHRARASLLQGFDAARELYVAGWQKLAEGLLPIKGSKHHAQNMYQISAAVMRTHESKQFPGGIVASLAIPWGASKGDNDKGYHLVWPRDMVQTVGGLLAVRGHEDCAPRAVLSARHARSRWPLAAEHVFGWAPELDRHPTG